MKENTKTTVFFHQEKLISNKHNTKMYEDF